MACPSATSIIIGSVIGPGELLKVYNCMAELACEEQKPVFEQWSSLPKTRTITRIPSELHYSYMAAHLKLVLIEHFR